MSSFTFTSIPFSSFPETFPTAIADNDPIHHSSIPHYLVNHPIWYFTDGVVGFHPLLQPYHVMCHVTFRRQTRLVDRSNHHRSCTIPLRCPSVRPARDPQQHSRPSPPVIRKGPSKRGMNFTMQRWPADLNSFLLCLVESQTRPPI